MSAPFSLRVEAIASSETVSEALCGLARTAARLGLTIETTINGIDVFACPGESGVDVNRRYDYALAKAKRAGTPPQEGPR